MFYRINGKSDDTLYHQRDPEAVSIEPEYNEEEEHMLNKMEKG